ncbi:MAG TPA: site-2 protease family protein [Asticcacaulis sp.]|nr:site-2 protease family protein [Asticcacaulis sp.]
MKNISVQFLLLLAGWLACGMALVGTPQVAALATFGFVLLGWIVSLCLHEYAHAVTAAAFGDDTIAAKGYLSLNPLLYFRGAGSLILPVIALVLGGIALPGGAVTIRTDLIGKPWQQSLVALAGPLTTLVCAVLALLAGLATQGPLSDAFYLLAFFELMAFVLNILPIPGLDGFMALRPWAPAGMDRIVPQKIAGLIAVGALLLVFFYGYALIIPVLRFISETFGIDLTPVGRGFDRFHFW